MSASFYWEPLAVTHGKQLRNGVSDDARTLNDIFRNGEITSNDISKLRAMHAATRSKESLWGDIADTLERLQGSDPTPVAISVWVEY